MRKPPTVPVLGIDGDDPEARRQMEARRNADMDRANESARLREYASAGLDPVPGVSLSLLRKFGRVPRRPSIDEKGGLE